MMGPSQHGCFLPRLGGCNALIGRLHQAQSDGRVWRTSSHSALRLKGWWVQYPCNTLNALERLMIPALLVARAGYDSRAAG